MPRHLPLCVLMRDDGGRGARLAPVASEADALVRAAAASRSRGATASCARLKNAGALVLDARPDDVTPLLVKRYLEVKARRLL